MPSFAKVSSANKFELSWIACNSSLTWLLRWTMCSIWDFDYVFVCKTQLVAADVAHPGVFDRHSKGCKIADSFSMKVHIYCFYNLSSLCLWCCYVFPILPHLCPPALRVSQPQRMEPNPEVSWPLSSDGELRSSHHNISLWLLPQLTPSTIQSQASWPGVLNTEGKEESGSREVAARQHHWHISIYIYTDKQVGLSTGKQ